MQTEGACLAGSSRGGRLRGWVTGVSGAMPQLVMKNLQYLFHDRRKTCKWYEYNEVTCAHDSEVTPPRPHQG